MVGCCYIDPEEETDEVTLIVESHTIVAEPWTVVYLSAVGLERDSGKLTIKLQGETGSVIVNMDRYDLP
jgi:hypothetical protein